MLKSLAIRDVVLIQKLDLEFSDGLTVLTGETGAGKSILLDSLSLALGARGDTTLVRPGAKEASVTACFELPLSHPIGALLSGQGYDFEGELIVRRVLGKDGRSRAFLNDTPVSIGFLKTVGDLLVEIHGQFASHKLLNPATHRETLDAYGDLNNRLSDCRHAFQQWQYRKSERSDAEKTLLRAKEEEDYLRKSVADLEKLDPRPDEEEALIARRTRLMNSEKIVTALGRVYQSLADEDSGALKILGEALTQLERISDLAGGDLDTVTSSMNDAFSSLSDVTGSLEQIQEKWGDVSELPAIDDRLFALRDMARKHQVPISELPDLLGRLKKELTQLELGEDSLTDLLKQEGEARLDYIMKAEELSKMRLEAAGRLDTAVQNELPALKLGKATFKTDIQKLAESDWTENGMDKVAFLVSTNQGMPLSPIHKIASGGELARFMLALKVNLSAADDRESMCTAVGTDEQAVALRVIAGPVGSRGDMHQAAVTVLAVPGRDALADDAAAGILPDMDHLGPGVRLLPVAGHGHGIEFGRGMIPLENGGRVLPGDGRPRLDLRPAEVAALAAADAALGDEVQDAAAPLRIAGIPVLYRRIAHVGAFFNDDFHDRRMQLVLVAHRRRAALHVTEGRAFVRDDERPLELTGAAGVDAEITGEVHRAFHALGDIAEGTVGKDRGIERRIEIVPRGDDARKVFAHQVRMFAHRFGKGTENDAFFRKRPAEGRGHGHGIKNSVHGDVAPGFDARQDLALVQRNPEFVESLHQRGIDLRRAVFVPLGRSVIDNLLEINHRQFEMAPGRRRHLLPFTEGVQAELQQPLRLALAGGNGADDLLTQAFGHKFLLDLRDKALLIVPGCADGIQYFLVLLRHHRINRKFTKESCEIKLTLRREIVQCPFMPGMACVPAGSDSFGKHRKFPD